MNKRMAKYIIKRLLLAVLTFVIIFVMLFFLIRLLPNPISCAEPGSDKCVIEAARRAALGYDKPIIEQMFIYLGKVFGEGDFGTCWGSFYYMQNVADIFWTKMPPSMLMNIYTLIFAVPLGIGFGIFAALKKNKWEDQLISVVVMLFISVPSFVYAFMVQYFLCASLGWFPTTMKVVTNADGSLNWFAWEVFWSMIPAILSLSFGTIAGLTRYTRAELTEVLTSDFMLLARTKGLSKTQATIHHALRNAMVPILPMIIGEFIGILSGSLIIEKIFSIPGIGNLYIDSIGARNDGYDMFMFLSMFYVFVGLLAAIIIDLSYGFIDPRIVVGDR